MLCNDCAPARPNASPGFDARGWFCRCQRLPFFAKPRPLSLQCMYRRYAPRDSALRFQARVLVPASPLSSLSGFRETLPLLLSAAAAAERCRCCCCRQATLRRRRCCCCCLLVLVETAAPFSFFCSCCKSSSAEAPITFLNSDNSLVYGSP